MPLPMYEEPKAPEPLSQVKNIIAVAAGKGGVGKSSVSVSLAHCLQARGYKVGLMDADVYGPSIRKMMPEDRLPRQAGEQILPALSSGIQVMTLAYFRPEEEATVVRAPIANGVIGQFVNQVNWGELDYLIIDFPPGTGDIQLTLGQQASITGAVMVTTPQEIALMDVRKAINMFQQLQIPVFGVIENMSYYYHEKTHEEISIFGEGGGQALAKTYGFPFLGKVPLDPSLCRGLDKGLSPLQKDPESRVSMAFMECTENLLQHAESFQKASEGALGNFKLQWEAK